jgi:hypothetical protein
MKTNCETSRQKAFAIGQKVRLTEELTGAFSARRGTVGIVVEVLPNSVAVRFGDAVGRLDPSAIEVV